MRQLIALAILAALGVGGWMFRDQIKAMVVSHAQGDGKTEDPQDPKTPSPTGPTGTPNSTTPGATTPGTTTPGSTIPGVPSTTGPGATTPGTTTPGTTTPSGPTISGPTDARTAEPFSVTLELRAVPDEKGEKLDFEGTTNLLPGTQLELAVTPRNGLPVKELIRVNAGSPKNTFKTVNHQLPDTQYQIDVVMYASRQTELGLTGLYSKPQMLKGPLVFPNTPEGIIVRATGVLRKLAKPKAPIAIALKAGTAK